MSIVTAAILEALRTGLRLEYNTAYKAALGSTFFRDVATTVPSTSKSNTYGWLGDFPDMREWVGDRVVKDMKEHGYEIVNKLFESTVGVQRVQIEDDNLGIYTPMAQAMGQAAAVHPDKLIAALLAAGESTLCYDGQNFFDTDHPVYPNHDGTGTAETVSNYVDGGASPGPGWYLLDTSKPLRPLIFQERVKPEFESLTDPTSSEDAFTKDLYKYGVRARNNVGFGFWQLAFKSKAALDDASFDAAMAAMMSIKKDGGDPMGVTPNLLVVPPALRSDASAVVEVMLKAGGASNPNYKAVDVKVVPWLA